MRGEKGTPPSTPPNWIQALRTSSIPLSWYQNPVSVRYVAGETSDCLDSRKLGRKPVTVSPPSRSGDVAAVGAGGGAAAATAGEEPPPKGPSPHCEQKFIP